MSKSSARTKKKSKTKTPKLTTRIPHRVKLLLFLSVACLASFTFRLFNSPEKVPVDDFLQEFKDKLVNALEYENAHQESPVLSTSPSLTISTRHTFSEFYHRTLETSTKRAKTDNPKIILW